MPALLPLYALSFNALLWITQASLCPRLVGHSAVVRWGACLAAPCALLLVFLRMRLAPKGALLFVTSVSIAAAATLV